MTLNFPSNPSDQEEYSGYIYDATKGVWNKQPTSSDLISEGTSNLYYTNQRAIDATSGAISSAISSANSYPDSALSSLIDSAPDTLNTLDELAAALNDDSNFAATFTNALAGKSELIHTHDDRYYTKTQNDSLLSNKAEGNGQNNSTPLYARNYRIQVSTNSNASGTIGINLFAMEGLQSYTVTGDISIENAGFYVAGYPVTIKMYASTSANISFPAGWVFVTERPTSLTLGKTSMLTITCFGTSEDSVVAAFVEEP